MRLDPKITSDLVLDNVALPPLLQPKPVLVLLPPVALLCTLSDPFQGIDFGRLGCADRYRFNSEDPTLPSFAGIQCDKAIRLDVVRHGSKPKTTKLRL